MWLPLKLLCTVSARYGIVLANSAYLNALSRRGIAELSGPGGKLGHLIYSSTASAAFDEHGLAEVLEGARRNNARNSVTGLLLYSAGYFFQVLEGEPELLRKLFEVISADTRHCNVTMIIQEPISRRMFGEWSMAYVSAESAELAGIEGLNTSGEPLANLGPGRAKKLLSVFIEGRWRARLIEAS